MRTFSHVVIALATGNRVKRSSLLAFAAGSALPDLPLLTLTGVSMLSSPSWAEGMKRMHSAYESSPVWIGFHNAPHSLVVLGIAALVTVLLKPSSPRALLLWGIVGATLHTVIDVVTHAGDGPRFLYPLSNFQFQSPVSYWDPAHFGRAFTIFEYSLDALLLVYMVTIRFWRRRSGD